MIYNDYNLHAYATCNICMYVLLHLFKNEFLCIEKECIKNAEQLSRVFLIDVFRRTRIRRNKVRWALNFQQTRWLIIYCAYAPGSHARARPRNTEAMIYCIMNEIVE